MNPASIVWDSETGQYGGICASCNGRGSLRENGGTATCSVCGGSGWQVADESVVREKSRRLAALYVPRAL